MEASSEMLEQPDDGAATGSSPLALSVASTIEFGPAVFPGEVTEDAIEIGRAAVPLIGELASPASSEA